MTILPKKKHQDSKKSDQDFESESRGRTRTWTSRDRSRPPVQSDEHAPVAEPAIAHHSPSSVYNDLDPRESSESSTLPYKRSRQRQQSSFFMSPATSVAGSSRSSREVSPDLVQGSSEDGYNSSDEHGAKAHDGDVQQKELWFEKQLLEKKGYTVKKMATDGACLFRAVADQVYGDQEMHAVVRKHCMDYMLKNRDYFSQYITEDFTSYIRRKRCDNAHGNHVEMQALSEMYNRAIEVYQYSIEPINTFHSRGPSSDDNPPIRVSYHGSVHYNSVIDPYNPTVGVGLGLAGYKTGLYSLTAAIKDSEAHQLEQAMLEDKIKATDWEATDDHLAEVVARESYLQWMKENQAASRNGASTSTRSSSTQSKRSPPHESASASSSSGPVSKHAKSCSPRKQSPSPSCSTSSDSADAARSPLPSQPSEEGASAVTSDWQSALGFDPDWSNDPVLAAVLAQSQQEYIDSLNRNAGSNSSNAANLPRLDDSTAAPAADPSPPLSS